MVSYGNYEEFRFFTGLRQSKHFALQISDCDVKAGRISITKAIVDGQAKNRPKTNLDREFALCRRAPQVLHAQFALPERMIATGQIAHDFVFCTAVGEPFKTTYLPYNRWTEVLETLPIRRRKPYHTILLSGPMSTGYISHWTRMAQRHAGDPDYAFTERIVAAQKRVISQSLEAIQQPRTSIGRGSLHDEVTALKQKPGGDIICFGGVSFGAGCWRPMSWTSCSSMSIPTPYGPFFQSSGSRARSNN